MKLKNNTWFGFLAGITAPLISFLIYIKIRFPYEEILSFVNNIFKLGALTSIISLTLFVNLFVFFVFIWSNADRSAKGVLGATFLYAFTGVLLKFMA